MNILIKGLNAFEHKILDTAFKLFEGHKPKKLSRVTDDNKDTADVIIIDSEDSDAMNWSKEHEHWLKNRTVIWVDTKTQNIKHASLKRPIMWVNLPIIISRVLDDIAVREIAPQLNENQAVSGNDSAEKEILVVDDSIAIRSYLSSLLSNEGFKIKTAEDGEQALNLIREQTFTSVFMDVLMPGIDGYEACRQIKNSSNGKNTPVIMLTGKGSMFDRIRGKMAGCSAYLTKPVDVKELRVTLEQYA